MPDERAAIDRVGHYWDALVRGDQTAGIALDPELATTIQQIHHLGGTPPAAARHRVWKEVFATVDAKPSSQERPMLHAITPDPLPFPVSIGPVLPERTRRGSRWSFAPLATAALVLLTLIGSFFAFGPGRHGRNHPQPVHMPAISATPATPETDESALVATFLWASDGGPDLPFDDPYFLAFDPAGNLWVPDGHSGRFQIFSPDGAFLESWGTKGEGEGEFNFQSGAYGFGSIAFDADGSFYVADMGNDRVQKFGPNRQFLSSWGGMGYGDGEFRAPLGIAVDGEGRVYVTDSMRNDVQVFDRDGSFLSKWGGPGPEIGQLSTPHAITVDGDGNLWVADFSNNRIQKFSPDGQPLASWDGLANGGEQFNQPANVQVDDQGRVYVVEWTGHRIQVFSPDGAYLASWGEWGADAGQFMGPLGIAFDDSGRVFVSEDGNDRIQAFRLLPPLAPDVLPAATPVAANGVASVAEFLWASTGSPDLPFREPNHPVVAPDGNIWVPDGWNSTFFIYAPDGTLLETWGTKGSGEGEFLFESGGIGFGGVAFDKDGNIYVADSGNHRVQMFAPDRTFITAWGKDGLQDGELRSPVALAVDQQGRVYVSDRGAGEIDVFDPRRVSLSSNQSPWIASWDGLGAPTGITVDDGGDIWVADEGTYSIRKYSPTGEPLESWDNVGAAAGQLMAPSGIAIDAHGRVFVADRGNRIQIFNPDGEFVAAWGSSDSEEGQFHGPYGVAVDDAGNVYVAEDFGLRLQAFRLLPPFAPVAASASTPAPAGDAAATSAAELLWQTTGPPEYPLDKPDLLAADAVGNLWVSDFTTNQFLIYSPEGQFLEAWGTPGSDAGEFDFAWEPQPTASGAVAFDAAGNFYVADPGNFRIQKFAPDRTILRSWGEEGTGDGQFVSPDSIAVDAEGRVYVADGDRDDVQVFDGEGKYLSTIGGFGFGDGELYLFCGSGLAFAPNGDLLVSDGCNHRLQRFSPSGEYIATIGGVGAGEGRFTTPSQIAVDAAGRIYVADYSNRRIQVFDADGAFLAEWDGKELGPSFGPSGIAVDGRGTVYVSDIDEDRLLAVRFSPP
jgi:DNA-binding beta-propeller fold protein YncE